MRQARTVISTYSADTFGVCSALYELGGMVVMHDASGCNSTYTTHDEPRWYNSDSLVFISGLTEMDAIMGNDDKLKDDVISAVEELKPKFVAIAGTPIPMMNGCDLEAVAMEIEAEAGLPCFGFQTNGMQSYLVGASEALCEFARRLTDKDAKKRQRAVNVLGATPLDFSINGSVESIKKLLKDSGWEIIGTWAMGSSLDDLARAGEAAVNLVISSVGLKTAIYLNQTFGTPYVVGTPNDKCFSEMVLRDLELAENDGKSRISFSNLEASAETRIYIVGEGVTSRSLAAAIGIKSGIVPKVVHTLEGLPELSGVLSKMDNQAMEEEEIQKAASDAQIVIADPLYRPILPGNCRFIALPHEAFSGRMFRKDIPDFTKIDVEKMLGQYEI